MTNDYLITRPEYWENNLGPKSKKYAFAPQKTNKLQDINQRSAESLARIQARYGRPNSVPLRVTVDSHLRAHT